MSQPFRLALHLSDAGVPAEPPLLIRPMPGRPLQHWAEILLLRGGAPPLGEGTELLVAEAITPRRKGAVSAAPGDCVQWFVFSGPLDGRDAEYNQWYTDRHLGDVLDIPGFASAQRYRITGERPGWVGAAGYIAHYEITRPAYETVVAEISRRSGGERMPISPAVNLESFQSAHYYSAGNGVPESVGSADA